MSFFKKIQAQYQIQSGETKIAYFVPKFKQLEYWKDASSITTIHCENKDTAKKIIEKSKVEQELEIRK